MSITLFQIYLNELHFHRAYAIEHDQFYRQLRSTCWLVHPFHTVNSAHRMLSDRFSHVRSVRMAAQNSQARLLSREPSGTCIELHLDRPTSQSLWQCHKNDISSHRLGLQFWVLRLCHPERLQCVTGLEILSICMQLCSHFLLNSV